MLEPTNHYAGGPASEAGLRPVERRSHIFGAAMIAVLGSLACAAGCGDPSSADSTTDGGGGDVQNVDSAEIDGPLLRGDGGECLAQGCPCSPAGATARCWTGPATSRGVGACRDGTTTCTARGEFSTWGPCLGEVLDCGIDSGMDASIDVAAMDSPIEPDAPLIDVAPDAPLVIVSDISCGHLAISNQYGELPATVCLLMPDHSVDCAKAVPNVSSDIGGPPAGLSATCISGGEDFFCAVTSAGGVMCWGNGTAFDPALDTQPLGNVTEALDIPGLASGVVDIAVGETHVCVRMANGSVMCWGNRAAEGNPGTWAMPASPTEVPGLDPGAVAIASGDGFSCALRTDGAVLCWGNNGLGELGNATTTDSQTPVMVQGLPARAVGIWADQATHPCALLEDGTVWCWGLIIEDPGHAATRPIQVTGFGAGVTALTTGGEVDETCALLTTSGVQCWGTAFNNNIGNGTPYSDVPVDILPAGSGAIEIRSSDTNFCALLSGGGVTCWGDTSGIATGSTGAPAPVAGL